jgi:hypothetical protein
MKRRLIVLFRRNETYVVAAVIGAVFVAAMVIVTVLLTNSITAAPYQTLAEPELKRVFATGYLRFREDDGTPYLKVELHNGTLWWIKKVEFTFDGILYTLSDTDAFRPLHFGALRCSLKKQPPKADQIEYDLRISKASGYPPGTARSDDAGKLAVEVKNSKTKN